MNIIKPYFLLINAQQLAYEILSIINVRARHVGNNSYRYSSLKTTTGKLLAGVIVQFVLLMQVSSGVITRAGAISRGMGDCNYA